MQHWAEVGKSIEKTICQKILHQRNSKKGFEDINLL